MNLQIRRLTRLLENPQASTKTSNSGMQTRYTGLRPKVSLAGDPMMGPNANPRLNREKVRTETVREMWRSLWIFSRAGAMIEEANVLGTG